ncbi:MAG: hypothetical protein HYU66_01530 [Armatimonadetes bacterium]|nr:hypothetical protein [Armatimonadota bacterium]
MPCRPLAVLAFAALLQAAPAERVVDPLSAGTGWILGGERINYVLGRSAVAVSGEQTYAGRPTFKLTYDFDERQRSYLSWYHTGPPIAGTCDQLSFQLFGDNSGCRLRLSLEDATGRWFGRDVGGIDWTGWKQVTVPVGDGEGWTALLRTGEERRPPLHPVDLRQVAVARARPDQPSGAVWLADLRAVGEVLPADLVTAVVDTGRPANLFDRGETPTLHVRLANPGDEPVTGRLSARIVDYFGAAAELPAGPVVLPPRGTYNTVLRYPTDRLGTYDVTVLLTTGGRSRQWPAHFALTSPLPERTGGPNARLGCCANLDGFSAEELPTALRLNRDTGFQWARMGFDWGGINPAPGVFCWDGPPRVDGPVGRAVSLLGGALEVPHRPELDCPGGLTVAFWARVDGANGTWQWPAAKLGAAENDRAYGVFFNRENGVFHFSAGYAKHPEVGHTDLSSGVSAWDGKWHHYAATYSPDEQRVALYVDGALAKAHPLDGGALRANSGPLLVGSSFPGDLDELQLYDRALAVEQVQALAGKGEPSSEGLVAGWTFDDPAGDFRDRSGHGLDLAAAEPAARLARVGLEHGIRTLGILGFPPAWASTAPPGAARPWVHAPKLDAWAAYVENTVRHYRGLVDHWEIWHEPNISVLWEPKPDAAAYFEVQKVAYAAAKRGNSRCTVLAPGLAGPFDDSMGFLDDLLRLGGARYCDALSIHPYRQSTPEGSGLVRQLEHSAALARANGGERPIWYTEDCWTTQIPGGSTEARQARLRARAWVLSLASGKVDKLIWFRLHDNGPDRFYTEHNYGICYADLTPKPAWFSHRTVAELLAGARPEGDWSVPGECWGRTFRTTRDRLAALWREDGSGAVALGTGKKAVTVVDLLGNETRVTARDGVVFVDLSESMTWVRGLDPGARLLDLPLHVAAGPAAPGAEVALTLTLGLAAHRGPAPELTVTPAAPLTLAAPPAWRAGSKFDPKRAVTGLRMAEARVKVPADAAPGFFPVTVEATHSGRTFRQELRLAVHAAQPDAGPVGLWHLDEGQGTRIADGSGNGSDGTVDTPQWVDGRQGKALAFDGTHIAVIRDAPTLNLRDEVTIAFWLKLTGETGTWQFPVTKYFQENVRRNYGIYLARDTLAACWSASYERGTYLHNDVGTSKPLNDGRWHHLAASYSMFDAKVRIFVDGELASEQGVPFGALVLTTDPVRLGVGTKGVIDEVGIWPRALTAEEVAALAR